MADVISFSETCLMFGPSAMMRTISAYVRQHAPENMELMRLADREELSEAEGGFDLEPLSITALKHLRVVLEYLRRDLPEAIANWNEPFRPKFHEYFGQFASLLEQRIAEIEEPRPGIA